MKKNLLALLIPLVFFVSGCQKDKFAGEYDLDNDGTPELIQEAKINRENSVFYLKNNDTVYLHKSPKTFTWGFSDLIKPYEGSDGYLDFWYQNIKGNKFKTFVKYNKGNGTFSGEKELGQ